MDPSAVIPVRGLGFVAGGAWVVGTEASRDLHIVGKLSLGLDPQGRALIMEAEPPGRHLGAAAPEELVSEAGRKLVLRGTRAQAGRLHLRRGERELAELAFASGSEIASIPMLSLNMTGVGPVEGDDWLVVEGADEPQGRRWCMLPRVGIKATCGPGAEQLRLSQKIILVDVQSWMVSLVFRGSRPISAGTSGPESIRLEIETLPAPGAAGPSPSPSVTASLHDVSAHARPAMPFRSAAAAPPAPAPIAMTPRSSTGTAELATPKPAFVDRDVAGRSEVPPAPLTPAVVAPVPSSIAPAPIAPPLAAPLPAPPPPIAPAPIAPAPIAPAPIAPPPPRAVATATHSEPPAIDVRAEVRRRLSAGVPLIGLDLRGASLDGLSFRSAKLLGLNLARARLNGADLSNADLRGACLDDAVLDGAMLDGVLLANATLERASIRNASLRFAGAAHCVASNVILDGSNLRSSDWSHAKLTSARLTRTLAQELRADGADLSAVDLSLSQFDGASLRGASLRGAIFDKTSLRDADLSDADLREVQGERALRSAKTEGARRD